MKRSILIVLFIAALALIGCGGNAKPNTTNPGLPLDPQGNWLFVMTGTTGSVELEFAGQLFEINPPVVTGNESGTAQLGFNCGGVTPHGQASGVNTINLSVDQTDLKQPPFSLTGTIADDQAHMSGTWTGPSARCTSSASGTWTAQLLTNVDGTWTGTASNGDTVTAVLTENTDQTSANMGAVTGTIAVSDAAGCIASAPLALASGEHIGEGLTLGSANDAGGVSASNAFTPGNVDPLATHATGLKFTFTGGACDGQQFTVDLTKQ